KKGTLYLTSTCPVDTSLTLIQSVFTNQHIYNQANAFALADPNSCAHLLLQLTEIEQIDLFGGLSEQFFEYFFYYSLDRNLLVVKSTTTSVCNSDYCPKKVSHSTNYYDIILVKTQLPVSSRSNYFEACLKDWQEPYIVSCGTKFKIMNEKESINIPKNAFKIDKYTSIYTGKIKLVRQINQWLLLILVINVAGISMIDEETYLEINDLPKEINFSSEDIKIRQSITLQMSVLKISKMQDSISIMEWERPIMQGQYT
ncbi:16818_t:CDS:2, partial [Gigaspora margarita]